MIVAAFAVSLIALVMSGLSALYTGMEARAARNADLRARRPVFSVTVNKAVSGNETSALYSVQNVGAEDLDSVVVVLPDAVDGVRYPVARLGQDFADEAELGPLEIKTKQLLVLCTGSAENLPEFRVRIRSRIGKHSWEDAYVLDDPRFRLDVY